jgi:hypothetical protein
MSKMPTWVPIVGGVAVLLVFVAIGGVLFGAAWFREHVDVAETTTESADTAFGEVVQRYAGKPPLIEMRGSIPVPSAALQTSGPRPAEGAAAITSIHVLAWNPRDRKLARIELPFWLVRMKDTPIQFGEYASGLDEKIRLRASDIERNGPGIIVDMVRPAGERALVWAQ